MQRVEFQFGGASKESACDVYGRVGVTDLLVDPLVLATGTDIGPQADQQTHTANLSSIG